MPRHRVSALFAFASAAMMLAAAPPSLTADESVTLRVNDARGRPGGLVEVVIRTYEPRGVGQGQICLQVEPDSGSDSMGVAIEDFTSAALSGKQRSAAKQAVPAGPLVSLEDFLVLSEAGDAIVAAVFDQSSQTADLVFESPSGTINQSDGALAILTFRIAPAAVPGDELELTLLASGSSLVETGGEVLDLELRSGELEILEVGDPARLEVVGDEISPGDVAHLGIETKEDLQVESGQIVLRYDPEIVGGTPAVTFGAYQGQASFAVDVSTPGWVAVAFDSPDASLRWPEGELLAVDLPTSGLMEDGHESPLWLDPPMTFLVDPGGAHLPVELKDGRIEFDD